MGKPKCEGCGKTKGVQFYDKAEVDLCPKCAEANRKPKGKPKMTDKMRLDFVKKHRLPIRYCDSWLVMTPKRTFQIRCGFRAAIDFLARETAKYKAAIRAERKGANRG